MKRLLIIIAMLFASVQLRASHLASELNLRMFDQAWFTVTLDNQVFGTPVTRFSLDELEPGTHFLRVTRFNFGYYGQAQPLVVFNGYINIPARSRVNAMIDRQWRFRINKIFALAPEPVWMEPVCDPTPVCNNQVPVNYEMNNYDFDNLVYTISRLSFESSRMQIAKQAIANNYFTSQQVAELVGLMTFESSKLDLAKSAYHKTVDKQNYFRINDLFTFESSIMDLNDYIFRS
jgi:Domain of unknown function (DUF4476)